MFNLGYQHIQCIVYIISVYTCCLYVYICTHVDGLVGRFVDRWYYVYLVPTLWPFAHINGLHIVQQISSSLYLQSSL